MNTDKCPVCYYQPLPWPPEDYNICICCGTEFGFDDADLSFDHLRDRWIKSGMPWFSREFPPPDRWNPADQVGSPAQAGR